MHYKYPNLEDQSLRSNLEDPFTPFNENSVAILNQEGIPENIRTDYESVYDRYFDKHNGEYMHLLKGAIGHQLILLLGNSNLVAILNHFCVLHGALVQKNQMVNCILI